MQEPTTSSVSRRNVIRASGGLVLFGGMTNGIGSATADERHDSSSCGDAVEGTRLRAAHLSPDAPDVDVYVDGDQVLESVPFPTVSDYLELESGTYTIQVVPAGEELAAAVIDEEVEVAERDYTLAAVGEVAGENQPLGPLVLEDDNSPVADDMARVRAVHASPDAPAVDVTAGEDGDPLFENVAFGESGYVEVPTGDYTLSIYPAGERDEAVFSVDVSVMGGAVYSAFAVGYLMPEDAPANVPFDVLITEDLVPEEPEAEKNEDGERTTEEPADEKSEADDEDH